MPDKKYLSKIVKGGNTLWLKDAEARQEIEDIKSSITGAMHFIGVSSTAIADGDSTGPWTINSKTYIASGTPAEGQVLLVAGDVAVYAPAGKAEREFVWSGDKWQEYGSTGSLKALAFKDNASATYTPAGTNAASAVTFSGQTDGDFVTGFNDDAVAPSFTEGAFTQGTLPSYTEGTFSQGTLPSKAADSFDAGSLPTKAADTFTQGTLPSLGNASTSSFATEGEVSEYDEDEETLTFSDATTSSAVTAQGTFDAGSLPTFSEGAFTQGTLPTFEEGAFSAGTLPSKEADTFSAGTLPTKEADTFNAGSAATPTTGKAITAVGTGTAAAQTFSGTEATITVS